MYGLRHLCLFYTVRGTAASGDGLDPGPPVGWSHIRKLWRYNVCVCLREWWRRSGRKIRVAALRWRSHRVMLLGVKTSGVWLLLLPRRVLRCDVFNILLCTYCRVVPSMGLLCPRGARRRHDYPFYARHHVYLYTRVILRVACVQYSTCSYRVSWWCRRGTRVNPLAEFRIASWAIFLSREVVAKIHFALVAARTQH